MTIANNHVYVANLAYHMGVNWNSTSNVYEIFPSDDPNEGGPPNGWKPSVDFLFKKVNTAVTAAGESHYAVAYVLSGRWEDGKIGLQTVQGTTRNKTRVQHWAEPDALGKNYGDVEEYIKNTPAAIEMPKNATAFAEIQVVVGQIITDVFEYANKPTAEVLAPGDVNFDGTFDSADLTVVFQAGEYEDSETNNSTWATGDWTGDREFDTSDLVFAFQSGGYELQNGNGFVGLPQNQQLALLNTLKEVHDAGVDMTPFLSVLKVSKMELDVLLGI